jgi:hypothetical protein
VTLFITTTPTGRPGRFAFAVVWGAADEELGAELLAGVGASELFASELLASEDGAADDLITLLGLFSADDFMTSDGVGDVGGSLGVGTSFVVAGSSDTTLACDDAGEADVLIEKATAVELAFAELDAADVLIESKIAELLVGVADGLGFIDFGASAFDCVDATEADADEMIGAILSEADGSTGTEDLSEVEAKLVGFGVSALTALVLWLSSSKDLDGTIAIEFDGLIVKNTAELLGTGTILGASLLFGASAEEAFTETDSGGWLLGFAASLLTTGTSDEAFTDTDGGGTTVTLGESLLFAGSADETFSDAVNGGKIVAIGSMLLFACASDDGFGASDALGICTL